MEFWLHTFAVPGRVADVAVRAEAWGFDGLLVADSQNLTADIWVELALAAAATDRIGLGPGVTNPVTRHPAVTASAAATLHAESGGRAVLGVGQGDSALGQAGLSRLSLPRFEAALVALGRLLSGEPARFDGAAVAPLRWLDGATSRFGAVPLRVAASGPRLIALGARHGDGVDLTVGAEIERLRWGVAVARDADPSTPVGAYVNVAVDDDVARARELVRGSVATFARFSAGVRSGTGLSEVTRDGIRDVGTAYEEALHGRAGAGFARDLGDEFIDRFALCGPAESVRERLSQIADAGVSRVVVVPGSLDVDWSDVLASVKRFADAVLTPLRR